MRAQAAARGGERRRRERPPRPRPQAPRRTPTQRRSPAWVRRWVWWGGAGAGVPLGSRARAGGVGRGLARRLGERGCGGGAVVWAAGSGWGQASAGGRRRQRAKGGGARRAVSGWPPLALEHRRVRACPGILDAGYNYPTTRPAGTKGPLQALASAHGAGRQGGCAGVTPCHAWGANAGQGRSVGGRKRRRRGARVYRPRATGAARATGRGGVWQRPTAGIVAGASGAVEKAGARQGLRGAGRVGGGCSCACACTQLPLPPAAHAWLPLAPPPSPSAAAAAAARAALHAARCWGQCARWHASLQSVGRGRQAGWRAAAQAATAALAQLP